MTEDIHSPTTAGPTPAPTPPVGPGAATVAHPAGTADTDTRASADRTELPFGIPPDRPEILVGAAFAGGLVAAFILKRLGSG